MDSRRGTLGAGTLGKSLHVKTMAFQLCLGDAGGGGRRWSSQTVRVPAGGVHVLWADGRPELGPDRLPFKLDAEGEVVLIYGPDKAMLDRVDWSAASADVSLARFPDGLGRFVSCGAPTCRVKNGAACAKTRLRAEPVTTTPGPCFVDRSQLIFPG